MKELENLLNSLIKMGWKLFDLAYITKCEVSDHGIYFYEGECSVEFCSYRELVSLESGLWQFCMEKGLCRKNGNNWSQYHIHPLEYELNYSSNEDYQYRLLESALIPEEELVKFLLDNIIVEGKKE